MPGLLQDRTDRFQLQQKCLEVLLLRYHSTFTDPFLRGVSLSSLILSFVTITFSSRFASSFHSL